MKRIASFFGCPPELVCTSHVQKGGGHVMTWRSPDGRTLRVCGGAAEDIGFVVTEMSRWQTFELQR